MPAVAARHKAETPIVQSHPVPRSRSYRHLTTSFGEPALCSVPQFVRHPTHQSCILAASVVGLNRSFNTSPPCIPRRRAMDATTQAAPLPPLPGPDQLPEELRGPTPRPRPAFVRQSPLAAKQLNIFLGCMVAGGMCLVLSP